MNSEAKTMFEGPDKPSRALIDKCVHCGFCLPTCPTYVLWNEEMDTPRGRVYLMKAGLEGRASLTPTFVGHFDACLGCMACMTACPSGVQYGPLIERTRAGQLVNCYRGRPALDRKALVAALLGLSQLMRDAKDDIESIDINPFLLQRRGGLALDALVVLAGGT